MSLHYGGATTQYPDENLMIRPLGLEKIAQVAHFDARSLHGGQNQTQQDRNDADHDDKFDEGERGMFTVATVRRSLPQNLRRHHARSM
jgi:hypothetical protein